MDHPSSPPDGFARLVDIMATLRAPDGCPWDRKQTHDTLKPYLLEETYEVLETIDRHDYSKLREELGDVLLQVIFHSQLASEAGRFTVQDVLTQLAEKLIRRHPHVFKQGQEDGSPITSDQVVSRWEEIKRVERQAAGQSESILDAVPKTLPALLRAYQLQARASRVGFDWSSDAAGVKQVFGKIDEELRELRSALAVAAQEQSPVKANPRHENPNVIESVTAELGDVFFSLVNLARLIKINPEDALRQAANRFAERFRFVERAAALSGRPVDNLSPREMDELWEQAKQREFHPHNQSNRTADARDTSGGPGS